MVIESSPIGDFTSIRSSIYIRERERERERERDLSVKGSLWLTMAGV